MAAAASTSPPSMASGNIVSSHFGARRGNWSRVNPCIVTAATSSSPRRTPPVQLRLSPPPRFQTLVASARRGKNTSTAKRSSTSKKEKKSQYADDVEEEDIDEDAFEALFSLLEEDLKNDNMSDDDNDDEITEEDLARLEEELAAALGDEDENDDDFTGDMPSESSDLENLNDSDEDEEEYRPPKLKNWQLRRLASALKNGRRKTSKSQYADDVEEEDIDEDAFEALFSLLEEDLKNDNMSDDDNDDEITEEDLARLEEELAAALGDEDENDDDFTGDTPSESSDLENLNDSDEDEEEYRPPKLKNWQLRRLASALKNGRRKTSIKNLSAELGLDRTVVLDLLREPTPNLLLMAASLPDKAAESPPEADHEQSAPIESLPVQIDVAETESKEEEMPVHVMKTRWSINKRLKKVQVETLERVYARTKRPTNAMISNIVHVTSLPWKTVVKWFEDKRVQDGVPERRVPFRRSEEEETVFSR